MELDRIKLNYCEGFDHEEIGRVRDAIDRLPLKFGANLDTFMEVFPFGSRIGLRAKKGENKRITCDNLHSLPKNYKTRIFLEGGGNIPLIHIDEFLSEEQRNCRERYALLLVSYEFASKDYSPNI